MTEEEIKALQEKATKAEELEKQLKTKEEELAKFKTPPKKEDDDVVKKLREEEDKKNLHQKQTEVLQKAIKFNLSIPAYLDAKKDLLTPISKKIFEEINNKSFTDEAEKSKHFQKNIIDDFFSLKENVDAIPETYKDRITYYKSLAEDEKYKRAEEFWDILKLTVETKELIKKQEEIKKANGGFVEKNDVKNNYDSKVFAMKSNFIKEN